MVDIKNRQKWNYKVCSLLNTKYSIVDNRIMRYIEEFPQQRFGQIICNYICPDYRNNILSIETKVWFEKGIFPENIDFFYEEPWETYERLK